MKPLLPILRSKTLAQTNADFLAIYTTANLDGNIYSKYDLKK